MLANRMVRSENRTETLENTSEMLENRLGKSASTMETKANTTVMLVSMSVMSDELCLFGNEHSLANKTVTSANNAD